MENQDLQYSILEAHAKVFNITTIHLTNNRHMINGIVNVLKSINTTVYRRKIKIQRLNDACNFFLTLADMDHRINQLYNGQRKLEADVATIYNYINTLGSKIVTPSLTDAIDLETIPTNIQAVIPSYLSLPNDLNTNIWSFYKCLEIYPLIYNEILIISLIVPLVDSTFHVQLYCIHIIPMVNKALCKTLKIELKTTYLAITDDKNILLTQ